MTTDPTSGSARPDMGSTEAPTSRPGSPTAGKPSRLTRVSAFWLATGAALVLLVMLIVFILQNSTKVEVHYLGATGTLSLGMALLIAAVGGGVVVAIAGIARVTQLRMHARRARS